MALLLTLTIIGVIMIALGLTGMYIQLKRQLNIIESDMHSQEAEIISHKRAIRIIQEREARRSDRIILANPEDIQFPNSEV